MERLAQHLADAHGGVNAPQPDGVAQTPTRLFTLGEVAVQAAPRRGSQQSGPTAVGPQLGSAAGRRPPRQSPFNKQQQQRHPPFNQQQQPLGLVSGPVLLGQRPAQPPPLASGGQSAAPQQQQPRPASRAPAAAPGVHAGLSYRQAALRTGGQRPPGPTVREGSGQGAAAAAAPAAAAAAAAAAAGAAPSQPRARVEVRLDQGLALAPAQALRPISRAGNKQQLRTGGRPLQLLDCHLQQLNWRGRDASWLAAVA